MVGSKQQWASREAITTMTAIPLIESALTYRRQIVDGRPVGRARSLWQIEPQTAGAVLAHPRVRALPNIEQALAAVGLALDMSPAKAAKRIGADDAAACVLARLLLWTDPHPLRLDQVDAWETYLRVWRPGVPRPAAWPACWRLATDGYFERGLLSTMRGAGMAVAGAAATGTAGPAIVEMGRNLREVELGEMWQVVVGLVMVLGIVMVTYGTIRARRRSTEQGRCCSDCSMR